MVVTGRARMVAAIAIFAFFFGVIGQRWLIGVTGTAILLWFGYEWVVFRYRLDVAMKSFEVERNVSDRRGVARSLWELQTYEVETVVRVVPGFGMTHLEITDQVPQTTKLVTDLDDSASALTNVQEIKVQYRIMANRVGRVFFPGVQVQLNDLHGLFSARRFLHAPTTLIVYPQIMKLGSLTPRKKSVNHLPPPGIHRNVKAGVGTELHEIRDYVPGDPPRSIAWKLSAKRDTLLCKQYENEVPIRCNLMLDVSNSVRLGSPNNTILESFIDLSSAIIETVSATRDPVGLTLFDEHGISVLPPAANRKSTMRKVQRLAEAAGKPLGSIPTSSEPFLKPGIDLARLLYPHVMQNLEFKIGFRVFPLTPRKRKQRSLRFQLATVLAAKYGFDSIGLGRLMGDDAMLSDYAQRFLAEYQRPYQGPIFDESGHPLFSDGEKFERVSKALVQRLARGVDNELFIIMADFVGVTMHLDALVHAIRCARARHHRVVVVYAWPNDYALPKKIELHYNTQSSTELELFAKLKRNERQAYVSSFFSLKQKLGKLEVPLVCSNDATSKRLLMSQLDLVRTGRVA